MKLMPIILNINHIEHDSLGRQMKSVENGQGVDRRNLRHLTTGEDPLQVFVRCKGASNPFQRWWQFLSPFGLG